MSSKEHILSKLRQSRRPFHDASPRPAAYLPVTPIADISPDGMLERLRIELERLHAEMFVLDGEDAARACVLDLLRSHNTTRIAAWHFKHIPVKKLYSAIQDEGYIVDYGAVNDDLPENERDQAIARLETAEVGLTGVDAVAASTGTLIVSAGAGKNRLPTVLPPVHIAVVKLSQIVPRVEDWLANVRADASAILEQSANICFITGPSRTGDIEKLLVLGVHGPKRVQVVVVR